jgi:hypothetical protein
LLLSHTLPRRANQPRRDQALPRQARKNKRHHVVWQAKHGGALLLGVCPLHQRSTTPLRQQLPNILLHGLQALALLLLQPPIVQRRCRTTLPIPIPNPGRLGHTPSTHPSHCAHRPHRSKQSQLNTTQKNQKPSQNLNPKITATTVSQNPKKIKALNLNPFTAWQRPTEYPKTPNSKTSQEKNLNGSSSSQLNNKASGTESGLLQNLY